MIVFAKLSKNTFKITLPSSTTREVIEWFETMRDNNQLAGSLVGLVYDSIKTSNKTETINTLIYKDKQEETLIERQTGNQGELWENLYNWQDSNNAVFSEHDNTFPRVQKKMLSV